MMAPADVGRLARRLRHVEYVLDVLLEGEVDLAEGYREDAFLASAEGAEDPEDVDVDEEWRLDQEANACHERAREMRGDVTAVREAIEFLEELAWGNGRPGAR